MDQIIILISLLNGLLLIVLIVGINRWQKSHGRLKEKTLTVILLGYFSFSFISEVIPVFFINPGVIAITIISFLLLLWGLGYPFVRWVYRQFNRSN